MIVQGIEVNIGDTVSFRTKHYYDKTDKSGKLLGLLHYTVARTMFDIVAYHKNLIHLDIKSDTPYTNMDYLVIIDEDNKYFATSEDWLVSGTFKKISQSYIDVRIYNVDNESTAAKVLQELRFLGYPTKRM